MATPPTPIIQWDHRYAHSQLASTVLSQIEAPKPSREPVRIHFQPPIVSRPSTTTPGPSTPSIPTPPLPLRRISQPAPYQSPGPDWVTEDEEGSTTSTTSSSSSNSDSDSNSSSSGRQRKRKRKKKQKKQKSKKKRRKTGPRFSNEDKKVVLRICCKDFEVYAHAKPKRTFWEAVQEQVKKEINKDHNSLSKTVLRWERSRRRVRKLIEAGMFSGEEEDDWELLIVLDEWIDLVDGLKEKQKSR